MSLDTTELWFYVGLRRVVENLNQDNWEATIALFDAILSNEEATHYLLQKRVRLDENEVNYECLFPAASVSFQACKNKLANAFDVDPELITCSIDTLQINPYTGKLSCFATFKFGGKNRLIVGLFGCESDDILCTHEESRLETDYYINVLHGDAWNGVAA